MRYPPGHSRGPRLRRVYAGTNPRPRTRHPAAAHRTPRTTHRPTEQHQLYVTHDTATPVLYTKLCRAMWSVSDSPIGTRL